MPVGEKEPSDDSVGEDRGYREIERVDVAYLAGGNAPFGGVSREGEIMFGEQGEECVGHFSICKRSRPFERLRLDDPVTVETSETEQAARCFGSA